MSTATRLTRDELDDVAFVISDWTVRGATERGGSQARIRRYYHAALNPRALAEVLHESQPAWPDERTARAAQSWQPLVTPVQRGWEQRMLLAAAVMVHLDRARASGRWLGAASTADALPPLLPPDDPDTPHSNDLNDLNGLNGLGGLDDFELGPA
jgi:hypothetical protein